MSIAIRPYTSADWGALWPILRANNAAGETFAFARDTPEGEMRDYWTARTSATFVACDESTRVVGSYYIKPNQPGLGSHVANAGYIVDESARGRGIAALMCEHSQAQALAHGFRAMQFNFVVASNDRAVRLWQRMGFTIVGRLPHVYHHATLGDVDAFVMHKQLAAPVIG